MDHLLTATSTVAHVTGYDTDAEGDTVPVVAPADYPCHVQPVRVGAEGLTHPGELTADRRWRIWWPAGCTAREGEQVTVAGHDRRYVVDDIPEEWANPAGTVEYVAAFLREVR